MSDKFLKVSHNLMDSDALNGKEKIIYIALSRYLQFGTTEGQVYPSIETLEKQTGFSRTTIYRITNSLIEKGLVTKINRKKDNTNIYFIHDFSKIFGKEEEEEEKESNQSQDATLGSPLPETSTTPTDAAEVSTEAIEQAKEQINYHSIVANHIDDKAIIDLMLEVITENQMQNITESMCVHVLERIQGYQPKNLKAYLKTLLLNQPNEEATDLWKDKQSKEERRLASPNNRFHNFKQRTYDYDELNARILNRDL